MSICTLDIAAVRFLNFIGCFFIKILRSGCSNGACLANYPWYTLDFLILLSNCIMSLLKKIHREDEYQYSYKKRPWYSRMRYFKSELYSKQLIKTNFQKLLLFLFFLHLTLQFVNFYLHLLDKLIILANCAYIIIYL